MFVLSVYVWTNSGNTSCLHDVSIVIACIKVITCDAMQNEEIVDDLRFDEKNKRFVQQPIHESHQQTVITFVYIKPIR